MEKAEQAAETAATAPTRADLIVAAVERLLREAPAGEILPWKFDDIISTALDAIRWQAESLDRRATMARVSASILGILAHALGRLNVPLTYIESHIGDFGLTIITMVHVPITTTPPTQQQ